MRRRPHPWRMAERSGGATCDDAAADRLAPLLRTSSRSRDAVHLDAHGPAVPRTAAPSIRTARARFTAHTAFDDPTSPPDPPPRESIEVRTLAFFATSL